MDVTLSMSPIYLVDLSLVERTGRHSLGKITCFNHLGCDIGGNTLLGQLTELLSVSDIALNSSFRKSKRD